MTAGLMLGSSCSATCLFPLLNAYTHSSVLRSRSAIGCCTFDRVILKVGTEKWETETRKSKMKKMNRPFYVRMRASSMCLDCRSRHLNLSDKWTVTRQELYLKMCFKESIQPLIITSVIHCQLCSHLSIQLIIINLWKYMYELLIQALKYRSSKKQLWIIHLPTLWQPFTIHWKGLGTRLVHACIFWYIVG